jgi:hypothetical protein
MIGQMISHCRIIEKLGSRQAGTPSAGSGRSFIETRKFLLLLLAQFLQDHVKKSAG